VNLTDVVSQFEFEQFMGVRLQQALSAAGQEPTDEFKERVQRLSPMLQFIARNLPQDQPTDLVRLYPLAMVILIDEMLEYATKGTRQ
jgi:hypothetical protein